MDSCSETGMPTDELFRVLCEAGLELGDFSLIENIGDEDDCDLGDRELVARRFDQFADNLETKRKTNQRKQNHEDSN
jgi:hypothetical protein